MCLEAVMQVWSCQHCCIIHFSFCWMKTKMNTVVWKIKVVVLYILVLCHEVNIMFTLGFLELYKLLSPNISSSTTVQQIKTIKAEKANYWLNSKTSKEKERELTHYKFAFKSSWFSKQRFEWKIVYLKLSSHLNLTGKWLTYWPIEVCY